MTAAAHPDGLVEQVARGIEDRQLIPRDAAVIVAVSGGPDSVALLRALHDLALTGGRRWRLIVAHLNHRLRPQAGDDERFVRRLARRLGLECAVESADVAAAAHRSGQGIEETARDLRYDFLLRVARVHGASRVALGHHRDDNVETVLYRLARGTHLRGLAGIPIARPLGQPDEIEVPGGWQGQVVLVRPLLCLRRSQIEAFLRRRRQSFRTDASNADTRFRRNLIRRRILPLLRQINPKADEAIERLADIASEVEHEVRLLAAGLVPEWQEDPCGDSLPAACLDQARVPPLLRRAVFRDRLEQLGVPLGDLSTETMRALGALPDHPGQTVNLPGGFVARHRGGRIRLDRPAAGRPGRLGAAFFEVELACPGRTRLPDGRTVVCTFERFSARRLAAHKTAHLLGVELLDADRLRLPLTCRPRLAGDRFRPLGQGGSKSVSNFLTDLKLPAAQRGQVLCLADRDGIVYVAPFRIDQRAALAGRPRRVLRIQITHI